MRSSNRKFYVFLLIIALFSSVSTTFAYSVENSSENSWKSSWQQNRSDPNHSLDTNDNSGIGELSKQMILMVLLVVCLGAAAIYLSKKLLPRFSNLPGKRIKVIETVHLGQRKSVHLLKIGSQEILIGSTNETITKLADITEDSFENDLPTNE